MNEDTAYEKLTGLALMVNGERVHISGKLISGSRKREDHCTHLNQAWCDCDWCRVIRAAGDDNE